MEEIKTLILKKNREGTPMLLHFSPYGHAEDRKLSGKQLFGRRMEEGDSEDIRVLSPAVSRNHGEFVQLEGFGLYRDLGSRNGTLINGEPVSGICRLQDGDVLTVPVGQGNQTGTAWMMLYIVVQGNLFWEKIDLNREMHTIMVGREQEVSAPEDTAMSRNHGVFIRSEKGWSVTDLNSTNGIFVNRRRIDTRTELKKFDTIRIGTSWFVYMENRLWIGSEREIVKFVEQNPKKAGPQASIADKAERQYQSEEIGLAIHIRERNVWKRFKKKTLLKDIDLQILPGEFVLILGGSGAGKSTFMKAVIGYEKAEGTITFGDMDIYEEYEQMKYEIGYVPQKDLIRNSDSVYNTILSSTRMKMEAGLSEESYVQQAEWVMELLGLSQDRDTLAGNLSGGQKKRLSIAVELVGDPNLFFLDEPDSGLDGVMARELMLNLKRIADMGKIVMVITHGPDRAADLFSKVLVLAKSQKDQSGHLAFFGTVEEAKQRFETDSLEQIVRRINRRDEGGEGRADEYIRKEADYRGWGIPE